MRAIVQDGLFVMGRLRCRVAIGHGGVVEHKREGDGGTPRAVLPLRRMLYRADRVARPACAVPVMPLAPGDGWCDESGHARYNQPVRLPFAGRHEELWRGDGVYDVVGVLGWNDAPVVRDAGSAIFLHVARPDFSPTEGCVALALPDLLRVLAEGLREISVV